MDKVVDIIFGGNAGSEGKGKFAGYLAKKLNYKHAITNFFPNAGHTWVDDNGEKVITRYLPSSLVNKDTKLYIGPGSAIDLKVLQKDINDFEEKYHIKQRLHIHPRAAIVTKKHIRMEKRAKLKRISSTLKGGSAALALKAMRSKKQLLARDIDELNCYLCDTDKVLHEAILNGEEILIEGAQGFELDINYGYDYPYTTSRQTTPAQLLADTGLPLSCVRDIYCVIRTYPIRVGGPSGNLAGAYVDWETIEERAQIPPDVHLAEKEITTVTKKTRRAFEQNLDRLKYLIRVTQPTYLCLNFIQYIDYSDLNKVQFDELSEESKTIIMNLESELNIPILYIGTGECDNHIITRG